MPRSCSILVSLILLFTSGYAQVRKVIAYKRTFQFSFTPGISTNGITGGSYTNDYSFNLFGGFSSGNRILEIGIISNLNLKSSTGIQFGGIANVVGSNAFINLTQREERDLISDGFESNFTGIQLGGLLNYVRTNSSALQVSGALNVVGGDCKGIQIAAIGNSAGESLKGLQLSGLYNVSFESVGGFQISSLFNFTEGQLSGLQLGLVNKAKGIAGRKSTPPTPSRGMQIGLINFSKQMDGLQIGLINVGGNIRGTQIGIINFFDKAGTKERVRNGTPVGLLNFGSKGSYFRLSYNEIFSTNMEYTTGNCLNCSWVLGSEMPYDDRNQIFNQNALIIGYDPAQHTWGFGYGFQKLLYNKFSVMPSIANKTKMITYGIKFMHLNKGQSFDKSFNLLNRINVDYGKRWRSHYVFISVALNYFIHQPEDFFAVRSKVISAGNLGELAADFWPGYGIGVQL